jgi:sec-independent protein translocase protein TatB
MFDIGFTEMMLIGIVALVVIGPERLPAVARTAGKYFSKLRNFMSSVRADVESELKADELRQIFEKQQEEMQSLKKVVSEVGNDIGLSDIANSISDSNPEPEVIPKPATDSIAGSKPKAKPKTRARAKSKAAPKTKLSPKAKSKVEPRSSAKSKARPRAKSAVKEG